MKADIMQCEDPLQLELLNESETEITDYYGFPESEKTEFIVNERQGN